MLTALSIRDIVLIEKLDIGFEAGLSVLTGETGAGKSILLDALALALGFRGDGGLVRAGQSKGQITAIFDIQADHPVHWFLQDNDLREDADEPVILRRIQNADGKTRAFVNDNPVSAGLLRKLGDMLVEIHGQHDDRALVDTASHRALLDAFGGLEEDVASLNADYQHWRKAHDALNRLEAKVSAAAREADYLRSSVNELVELAPREGEENELADRRQMMMKAEKIAGDIDDARDVLLGSASPVPVIANTLKRLERKAEEVPGLLEVTIEHLAAALDQLSEAQMAIEAAMRDAEFSPQDLEDTEERLFALRAASRKYGVPVENLATLSQKLRKDLDDLDAGEEQLAQLEEKVRMSRIALEKQADKLSRKRMKAAATLQKAVMAELPALKLEQAEFIVNLASDPEKITAEGHDIVEFHVRTNPGSRAGPMMKVASGGELSRFLLALKVVLADRGSAPTLVFDEIDTGVGGAVADAIGKRLARLADQVQVLSVTHAPQVAARADNHLLIAKGAGQNGGIATTLCEISDSARLEEVARMLSGAQITDEARAAAQKLIAHTE